MRYILLVLTLMLVVGCGAQKRVVVAKEDKLPSWYIHPPKSTATDLYALGEGKSQKEAVAEALTAMVATLSVSVSSSFHANTVVKEGRVNSVDATYNNDVQSDVQKIRISNYSIAHSKALGFKRYAVLVKSNKKKLLIAMKKELDQKFFTISQEENSLSRVDALKQLAYYKRKKESFKSIQNKLLVMNSLDENFDASEYIRKTQIISSKYQSLAQNIRFSLTANNAGNYLIASFSKGLSQKHFSIKKGRGKFHFTIFINAKIEKANAYGFTLARTEIKIVTKDYRGTIIGSNVLNITGQSSQGFAIAKQSVIIKLNAMIQKEGIDKILGVSI